MGSVTRYPGGNPEGRDGEGKNVPFAQEGDAKERNDLAGEAGHTGVPLLPRWDLRALTTTRDIARH